MRVESIGRRVFCALMAVLMAGCVTVPADNGRSDVDRWVRERSAGRDDMPSGPEVAEAVERTLKQPLDADASVRLALLQNPELRATYARLGIASADLYEAGRLSNPRLSAALLNSGAGGEHLILGLVQSLSDLLTLPRRSRLGALEFTQLKQDISHEVVALAARAEQSHYRLVAARQIASLRDLISSTAATSAELAERFHAAGNTSALALAQERASASQARLAALAAQADLAAARSAHARLLGLASDARWSVQADMPAPLAAEDDPDALVRLAQESRLDLEAARARVQIRGQALGLSAGRFVEGIDVGVEREREPDGNTLTGPTVALEVPLFNLQRGKQLRARSELEQAQAELVRLQLDVAHETRLAHAQAVAAKGRAQEFSSVLIPAREAIVARTQEKQSYMLVDQFELLAAKSAEYEAYEGYLQSVRDYWLARVELTEAVGARLPGTPPRERAPAPIQLPQPLGVTPTSPAKPAEPEPAEHQHHPSTGHSSIGHPSMGDTE